MQKDNVDFSEIQDIFDSYRIWNTDNEIFWYENIWEILKSQGLADYDDDIELCQVILRAVSLLMVYHEFSHLCDETCEIDRPYNTVEKWISPFILGQLFAARSEHIVTNPNYAVLLLADMERSNIVEAIQKEMNLHSFFVSLCATVTTFSKITVDEGGDELEEEIEPSSANEFWTLFKNNQEMIFGYAENNLTMSVDAYEWVTHGAKPLHYYWEPENE